MRRILALICLIVPGLVSTTVSAESRNVYKWLDSNGKVHYSDRLPDDPDATQRQILNASGIAIQQLDRPAEAESVAQRREMLRSGNRDVALVTSFGSESELRQAHEQSLSLLRSSISISQNNAARLQANLEQLQEQHQRLDASGQSIPATEIELADRIRLTLADQQTELEKLHRRQRQLEAEYALEIQRYRELTRTGQHQASDK